MKRDARQRRRALATIGNGRVPEGAWWRQADQEDPPEVPLWRLRQGPHAQGRLARRPAHVPGGMAGSFTASPAATARTNRSPRQSPSVVSCAVCGTTLATPTGGEAEFHGEIVETVEAR